MARPKGSKNKRKPVLNQAAKNMEESIAEKLAERLLFPTSIHDFGPFLEKQGLLESAAEIGVAEGRFSRSMIGWGFKKIYLVDVWQHLNQTGDAGNPQVWHDDNLRQVKEFVSGYEDSRIILQGFSQDVVKNVKDGSLSFVWVDGDHSVIGVQKDIDSWLKKIKKGGIMAFHDYNDNYGVKEVVDKFTGGKVNILPEKHIDNQGCWFYADDFR